MLKILLVSNEDACRSRMAEALLSSFGRGMMITTAGICEANRVPEAVGEVMEQVGHEISRAKPTALAHRLASTYDFVITLCKEAEEEWKRTNMGVVHVAHLDFADPLANAEGDEQALRESIETVYQEMDRVLYRLYRDELRELLLPRCSCGANTFCRCQ